MLAGPIHVTPRRRLLSWTALLGGALALSLSLGHFAPHAAPDPAEITPPGWWRLALAEADPRRDEELARQLSLPYAAGVVPASDRFGVRAWAPASARTGVNLYVSGHGPEAILMAMDGQVRHRWRYPFERAFPGRATTPDTGFFRRAALLSDGSLLAMYQGGGLIRLDAASRPLWTLAATPYNDFWVAPDEGRILYLDKRAVTRPDLRADGPLLEDFVVTIDGAGRELARFSLLAAFEASPFRPLLEPLGPTADIFHSNRIAVLPERGPRLGGAFGAGDLLVSLREIDTLAVLDPAGRTVRWARRGPYRRQHEPHLLPSGRFLLFDNLGAGKGRSRVVEVDPASGEIAVRWPPPGVGLWSEQAGVVRPLDDGHLLVVESERGAAFEVDADGGVVWEFRSPHRAGPRHELVAVLFDVVRYPPDHPGVRRLAATQAP